MWEAGVVCRNDRAVAPVAERTRGRDSSGADPAQAAGAVPPRPTRTWIAGLGGPTPTSLPAATRTW